MTIRHAARWVRTRRWWRAYHWWVVGVAAVTAVVLGTLGFQQHAHSHGIVLSNWDALYQSLQLWPLNSGAVEPPVPVALEVARYLAPAVAAYAVGVTVASVLRDEFRGVRNRFRRGHVIVCGLEAGWTLTRLLRDRGERVVAIERDPLHRALEACRAERTPVFVGDARDELLLEKAGVRGAKQLIAVCGDDALNIRVAQAARRLRADRPLRHRGTPSDLGILLHIADPTTGTLLRLSELSRPHPAGPCVDVFSVFDGGARALLTEYPPFGPAGDEGTASAAHLLVIGFDPLGEQLVVHAARDWRADHAGTAARIRPRVTVVAREAEARLADVTARAPIVAAVCTPDARPVEPDPLTIDQQASLLRADGEPDVSSVFVCLDDDIHAIAVALAIHERLGNHDVPVVVRLYDPDLATALPPGTAGARGGLRVFGLFDHVCRPGLLFAGAREHLARRLHEEYLRQVFAHGAPADTKASFEPWDRLPEEFREANLAAADRLTASLHAIGCAVGLATGAEAEFFEFAPAEIEQLAELEHAQWMQDKLEHHWAVGPSWDAVARTNPSLVEWAMLPDSEKEKDRHSIRRLPFLLADVGFQLVRSGAATAEPDRAAPAA